MKLSNKFLTGILMIPVALCSPIRFSTLKVIGKAVFRNNVLFRESLLGPSFSLRDELSWRTVARSFRQKFILEKDQLSVNDNRDVWADIYRDAIQELNPSLKGQLTSLNEAGNLDIVKSLLAEKSDDQYLWLELAFGYAISHGHQSVVKHLLGSSHLKPEAMGSIIFEMASEMGDLDYVNLLLNWRGPNDERIDPSLNEDMALLKASMNGHVDVVERLLQDPRVTFTSGSFAKICAAGQIAIVELCLLDPRVEPRVDALIEASKAGKIKIVERLLQDTRIDPGLDNSGALRFACLNGHLAIVQRLLQDSRVNPRELNDEAAVNAYRRGHQEVFLCLEEWYEERGLNLYHVRYQQCC